MAVPVPKQAVLVEVSAARGDSDGSDSRCDGSLPPGELLPPSVPEGIPPAAKLDKRLHLPCELGILTPCASYSGHPWSCCTRRGLCPAMGTSPAPRCPLLLPRAGERALCFPTAPGA